MRLQSCNVGRGGPARQEVSHLHLTPQSISGEEGAVHVHGGRR